ncbi:MAG: 23S rRNA (uracil(1939)-C(5))-methyltransferase RlmD [Archangiaceae bacterium]|nr:23S rRNA (uracil(1939)-C(5))-methyltransferase RlmD [Archangiaceae bacterium]
MRRLELSIERLSKSGDGVAEVAGRAVFVPGTVPGDRVLAEVFDQGKAMRGELLEVLDPAPGRRSPVCPLADRCGGCDWMHLTEALQHEYKQQIVTSALEHLGGIGHERYELLPFVFSPMPYNTRRRAVLHPVKGRLGFFGKRSHTHVEVDLCPALTPPLESLPGELADALGTALKDIDEVHLLEVGGEVSFALMAKGALRPKHREVAQALIRDEVVAGVVLVPGAGKGAPELLGKPVLEADGVRYRPDAFSQANADVNAPLVDHAIAELDCGPDDHVLELYSGNGNFTFPLAAAAKSVLAVESSTVSVGLAQDAARKQGFGNVRFVQGDCEKFAKGLVKESKRFDRVLLDPPRTGAPGIGEWASRLLASKVVYIACDPGALARDAAELVAQGFVPRTVRLFDLFPQTRHIEVVMSFTRGSRG